MSAFCILRRRWLIVAMLYWSFLGRTARWPGWRINRGKLKLTHRKWNVIYHCQLSIFKVLVFWGDFRGVLAYRYCDISVRCSRIDLSQGSEKITCQTSSLSCSTIPLGKTGHQRSTWDACKFKLWCSRSSSNSPWNSEYMFNGYPRIKHL